MGLAALLASSARRPRPRLRRCQSGRYAPSWHRACLACPPRKPRFSASALCAVRAALLAARLGGFRAAAVPARRAWFGGAVLPVGGAGFGPATRLRARGLPALPPSAAEPRSRLRGGLGRFCVARWCPLRRVFLRRGLGPPSGGGPFSAALGFSFFRVAVFFAPCYTGIIRFLGVLP